jgi:hypothetical protein
MYNNAVAGGRAERPPVTGASAGTTEAPGSILIRIPEEKPSGNLYIGPAV